ncbi:hypothetical protein [Olivibacter sp. XZL3]|uniref:hypothetical protein n=1 Tax=Olivibacter sp. XZL3 TaxID=1735116 RepID=UPI001066B121|nr:hypothetical protein [Olivibacter sp. XZL3]
MNNRKITLFEYLVLGFISIVVLVGVVASRTNLYWFEEVYVVEDGFVENLTVLPLIGIIITGFRYLKQFGKKKGFQFCTLVVLTILASIFVAGEEISWGQRIFNVRSSEFFQRHNAQGETNLHNLVVGGKKVNKIIFSQLLVLAIALYLLVLPQLYKRKPRVQTYLNHIGIPIPRFYQIIGCIVLFASITLIPSGKDAEILEVGITHLFFLIYLFPENKEAFTSSPYSKEKNSA